MLRPGPLSRFLAGACSALLWSTGPAGLAAEPTVERAAPALQPAESVEALQKAVGEWVRLRSETARLETEWHEQRGVLTATLQGLEETATAREERRNLLAAQTEHERTDLAEVRAKNEALARSLLQMEQGLQTLQARLAALRRRLPPRLAQGLTQAYLSLNKPDLSPGERLQYLTTILNRLGQFNRAITTGEEELALDPARGTRLLEVIYWGLSHGYALDRAGRLAWLGTPAPDGWRWEPSPGAADRVETLLRIYADKSEPEFVPVPARLLHPNAATEDRQP